jgi:hypothetical protein
MNWLNNFLILLAAFISVFFEAAFQGVRPLLATQVDLLPALMVYASLWGNRLSVPLLAVLGGLFYDSLSANPLGITIVPLFLIGTGIQAYRDLILRDQLFAQITLGLAASLAAPLITLLLLLTTGHQPLAGWGTLWQLSVMATAGAVAAPVWCLLFGLFNRIFVHQSAIQSSFRPDREIRRGR